MPNFISIIIIAYGEIGLLKDCLKSLKNSNFWNFYNGEVIIINNLPSVPIKPEFVKKNLGKHQYRLIKNKKNLGYSRAANLGFKKPRGKPYCF